MSFERSAFAGGGWLPRRSDHAQVLSITRAVAEHGIVSFTTLSKSLRKQMGRVATQLEATSLAVIFMTKGIGNLPIRLPFFNSADHAIESRTLGAELIVADSHETLERVSAMGGSNPKAEAIRALHALANQ